MKQRKRLKSITRVLQDSTGFILSEAQTAFMKNMKNLEETIEDKEIFLDIIRQVQLWYK